jgi:antitoxin component HigA of HigAB toxin-antitoxin module
MKMTKAAKGGYKLGRSFLELLERFPLMTIQTDGEYDQAIAVLQDLLGRDDLNKDQHRYLDSLLLLVNSHEEKAFNFDESISPREAVKSLLAANKMTAADLGRIIGSPSYASMILSGDRSISKENAKKLAERFRVDVGIFL